MSALRGFFAQWELPDWLYLLGIVTGWLGFLFSPWPWVAEVYLAACMFVAVALHARRPS